ncbi:MAG TPA: YbjN domain-containing protein [Cyclobacteriaceae bacterium]|nr:YbjN domain-containing protein [Cyclobacteriaceae bacterium]HMV09838.1 YbjN domain-containing protein [Cyclobacteriaceae bacterium]HMV89558.1 YbjN domain-containing protein [Cyclobacteriaceae bacterium]HMX00453.1 YbjN domain-containing protein [Cyclobacteriaceae bacterium]HMX50463.1 YbjN domain-containing protein [Cyclobacteriaceae bacterium]
MNQPIQHYYNMFEQVLAEYKVDPATARGQAPGQWNLKLGSASVWVDIFQSKDANGNLQQYGYLQVLAPVCDVPINNQHLFTKELLEINHQLYGVAFTIFREKAYIKSIRELQGLDISEIKSTLDRVGIYANDWDDKLKAKYGIFPDGGRG